MAAITSQLLTITSLTMMLLLLFSCQRGLLWLTNRDLAMAVPVRDILRSVFIGWRFDLLVISPVMLLPIVLQIFPSGKY